MDTYITYLDLTVKIESNSNCKVIHLINLNQYKKHYYYPIHNNINNSLE